MNIIKELLVLASLLILNRSIWAIETSLPPSPCTSCATNLAAGFYQDVTFTKADSPYCLIGDNFSVSNVTIEPGVCFIFSDANLRLEVLTTITAVGTPDEPIVFTADGAGWRGFLFDGTPSGSQLVHCRIENSIASGITIFDGIAPEIRHCTITGNSATDGGGIRADGATLELTLENCTIHSNVAEDDGGGVWFSGSKLILDRCEVSNNQAGDSSSQVSNGGGVFHLGESEISNSLFCNNRVEVHAPFGLSATARGGGLFLLGPGNVTNSVFRDNQAIANGDAFSGPIADGGGIYVAAFNTTIANCVIACNAAEILGSPGSGSGGGISTGSSPAVIRNCTVANNLALGLVDLSGSGATVSNSIFYFNDDGYFGDQIFGTSNVSFSNIQGSYPGTGNIDVNPGFLVSDGCGACDLSILPASLVVDAGDPDPSNDDVRFPPSHGTVRNDMGVGGGPQANDWFTGWDDLGLAKEGVVGFPHLEGTGALLGGSLTLLELTNAAANSTAFVLTGFSRLNAPFKGGVLVPDLEPSLLLVWPVNNLGESAIGFPWPNGYPSNCEVAFQFWILDPAASFGFSASNAVRAISP